MKALIKVGHSIKVQAQTFNPVESTDALEIEVDVENDEQLIEKFEHYQKIVRERTIKNVMTSTKEFLKKRAEVFEKLESKED